MDTTHCIYRHIRPDTNEVFYVGQGKEGTGRQHDKRRNELWRRIVFKNGGQYKIEVMLDGLTQEEANQKETEFIALYGYKKDGTGTLANLIKGGKGVFEWKMPVNQIERLREQMTGNKINLGRKHTEEAKRKMSLSHIGQPPTKGNTGRVSVHRGKTFSQEIRDKMSKAHMGNPSTKGKIWITDGVTNVIINGNEIIPEGWKRGRRKLSKTN